MTDQKEEGIYEWKSGHGGLSFDVTKHWRSGHPQGEVEDCLFVYESQLCDYRCNGTRRFGACQRRKTRKSKYLQIADIILRKE